MYVGSGECVGIIPRVTSTSSSVTSQTSKHIATIVCVEPCACAYQNTSLSNYRNIDYAGFDRLCGIHARTCEHVPAAVTIHGIRCNNKIKRRIRSLWFLPRTVSRVVIPPTLVPVRTTVRAGRGRRRAIAQHATPTHNPPRSRHLPTG